ncbi:MAG: hypothetical protein KC457_08925, partial [Myxococcales bacterium]|nr:hypothetical protein [Myxococcales bacterium]
NKTASELEDRPPLPEALLDPRDGLEIVQWHRRGFSEGRAEDPGCARRLALNPDARGDCPAPLEHAARRRRPRHPLEAAVGPCSRCDGDSFTALTPAEPAVVTLARGTSALVPTALWSLQGQTLPHDGTEPAVPAEPLDAVTAADYSLADRATRLLAVLRTHAALRYYFPQTSAAALREPLRRALCQAAEVDDPRALAETLMSLLAAAGDGNAMVDTTPLARARRKLQTWTPAVVLRWVEERAVVTPVVGEALPAGLEPGDELVAVDGVDIGTALAEALARTPAARAGARVQRALVGLLQRRRQGEAFSVDILRRLDDCEGTRVSVVVHADLPGSPLGSPGIGGDLRPAKAFVERDDGWIYADATRLSRLRTLAGVLHRRRRRTQGLILDLRGKLADPAGSLAAHFTTFDRGPLTVANLRVPSGPDRHGSLPLADAGQRRIQSEGPSLDCPVIVLVDERTHGRAELEAMAFELLGSRLVGSPSAGDLAPTASIWLPGGWLLRFSCGELRRSDGSVLWSHGVVPEIHVRPTVAGLCAGVDEVLAAAK